MKATNSIGILREVKSKWERRVAITPSEVKKLVDRNIRVLIQPCERRVFKDLDYQKAGAVVTDDLSSSSFIIGVKEIPKENLREAHSYLNFPHVIKGQPANMPFLDECFKRNVRLFDYEGIKNPNTKLRIVAFGRFAGLAGMVTGMRGLGEHLLAQGSATPFLNMSSCYMYHSLHDAQVQVTKIGEMISKYGLPSKYGPFVFTFTGGGNVTNGALEIFKLLPHEFVKAEDLPRLKHNYNPNKVYGCVLPTQCIVEHHENGKNFEEGHYFAFPEEYHPVFHEKVAPYTSVLVNGMYWDHRYPRLLTNEQMKMLQEVHPHSMLALFDISCDPEGAVQFLKKTTDTDSPYFTYHPAVDDIVDEIDGQGVLVLAVDALPAELPLDSSQYFSEALYPFLERLATSDSDIGLEEQEKHLGPEMFDAMITWNSKYTPNYQYIDAMRREQAHKNVTTDNALTRVFRIDGHLFDSGLINQILDLVEAQQAEYTILDLQSKVNTIDLLNTSRLILQIDMVGADDHKMAGLVTTLQTLCDVHPKAEAKVVPLPFGATVSKKKKAIPSISSLDTVSAEESRSKVLAKSKRSKKNIITDERDESRKPPKKVLLLGSGFVTKPVIDYLSLSGNNTVTVASNDIAAADALTDGNIYCRVHRFDAKTDDIDGLVSRHDVVVSLLPATMHIPIAKSCIKLQRDMITASYVSEEMANLHDEAKRANIILLNECGLDPGLDHMSAVRLINGVDSENEHITTFNSFCGGLPSPESADNSFGYKFSWSPIGVLSASGNEARYLENGSIKTIPGDRLLIDGRRPLEQQENPYSSLSLEVLANRDSLKYIEKYKLDKDAMENMYRGTLRYHGFSDMMFGCRALGLLEGAPHRVGDGESWYEYLHRVIEDNIVDGYYGNVGSLGTMKEGVSLRYMMEMILKTTTHWKPMEIDSFLRGMDQDLNVFDKGQKVRGNHDTVINAFCSLLESKLCFDEEAEERDMVLMINRVGTNVDRIYESSLLVYGDEEYSAMARTVGFPMAVATQFLLNGEIDKKHSGNIGVMDATNPFLGDVVLNKCEDLGIKFKSRTITEKLTQQKTQ